jgi:hypothetical protein
MIAELVVDGDADNLPDHLSEEDYKMCIDCQAASVNAEGLAPLDPPPAKILDIYSSVLGDGWHLMDRPKIQKGHVARKPFKVALQEGLYVWNPNRMEHAERTLMQAGMSDKMIQAKKYFNVNFFRVRCGRAYVMPSHLYWRMRAVFAFYGKIIDPETKRPLFNKAAWAKANNLLKDILLGLYIDPPPLALNYS